MRGATGRVCLGMLLLAAFFLCGAETEKGNLWDRIKGAFQDKEKPLPPVEEVYNEAEQYYHGRETWLGKLVRKTQGEDSWTYRKGLGIKRKNYIQARELYQQVVDNYPFSKYSPPSELKIADCHFQLEEYEQAVVLYRLFVKMHARREEVPYALYQEGMCNYNRMRKPSRDQDHTRSAVASFSELAGRFPDDAYGIQAAEKLNECRTRLAEHELLVADFYYKHKEYWAAAARYREVWRGYPGLGFDDRALFLEGSCYERLGKNEMAEEMFRRTVDAFPETEYGKKASQRLEAVTGEKG